MASHFSKALRSLLQIRGRPGRFMVLMPDPNRLLCDVHKVAFDMSALRIQLWVFLFSDQPTHFLLSLHLAQHVCLSALGSTDVPPGTERPALIVSLCARQDRQYPLRKLSSHLNGLRV